MHTVLAFLAIVGRLGNAFGPAGPKAAPRSGVTAFKVRGSDLILIPSPSTRK
jgi:hypothetical protein